MTLTAQKYFSGTNTLAYFGAMLATKKKILEPQNQEPML
jgi:hypothetical protein